MAMLQREKKASSVSASTTEERPPSTISDTMADDQILESLSKEPVEYQGHCCLSAQVVESLQSVKHTCLRVLDILLLQIVKDLPSKHVRRLSDPSSTQGPINLLGSITQNTNILHELSPPMTRSKSTPLATSISDVHRILDSHPQSQCNAQDYTLSCSLAALLNDVYRLLELNPSNHQDLLKTDPEQDVGLLQQELHDQVSMFQRKRAAGIMAIDETDASQEMIMLWDEIDHLMNIVCQLAVRQQQQEQQPPAYNVNHELFLTTKDAIRNDDTPPPAYQSIISNNFTTKEKKDHTTTAPGDLEQLLAAIDRLSHIAPRLNNQRIELTEKQAKELAAATLSKTIERLSKDRMDNQRAHLPEHQLLQNLVQQIQKSASRSLDNQRVTLGVQQQKNMDFASIHGILERLNRGRYTDQDWISHEEFLINDLTRTTDLLVKSLDRPAYNTQRFSLSAEKERTLFMYRLFNKVESLEGCRLVNQDADSPSSSNDTMDDDNEDLQLLLNNIYKSAKPHLDNQRASFSLL